MDVSFRYAAREDLERIVTTYNSTIASRMVTADLEEVTVQSRQTWFEMHKPGDRPLWIVLCDEQYAGWMSFSSFYGRPAYSGTAEVSIYLENNFRGRGIGRVCMKKAIHTAPTLNITNLLGFIFGHNLSSLKLFEAFGFEQWGCLPGVANMDGIPRDLVILGKKCTI